MITYLNNKIKGINKKIKEGSNTRKGSPRNHVYKVEINGQQYWKFQIKRQEVSTIKYFKKRKEAKEFVKSVIDLKDYKKALKKFK